MSSAQLDSLEARVAALEVVVGAPKAQGQRILGQIREGPTTESSDILPIIDNLRDIKAGLSRIIRENPELSELVTLVKELDPYVGVSANADPLLLPRDAMKEVILQSADLVRRVASMMEAVEQLKRYSELPSLKDRLPVLSEVRQLHAQQVLEAETLSRESGNALRRYRHLVAVLSQLFVVWDNKVSGK